MGKIIKGGRGRAGVRGAKNESKKKREKGGTIFRGYNGSNEGRVGGGVGHLNGSSEKTVRSWKPVTDMKKMRKGKYGKERGQFKGSRIGDLNPPVQVI